MPVIKCRQYIIALLLLALVVLAAAVKNGRLRLPEMRETAASQVSLSSTEETEISPEPEPIPSPAAPVSGILDTPEEDEPPLIGVWIPYMSLITPEKSEAAFLAHFEDLLDRAKALGVNAVFVHVRPFADSFYPSAYEPWSHILTGEQGKDPGWDPMEKMIDAAHERDMAFHAWVNPLRISTGSTPGTLSEDSFYSKNKDENPFYFIEFEDGIYYNPASAYIRERIARSTAEIAEKYDVDGIHFDDYFYPTDAEEIDSAQYEAYAENTEEPLPLHEWRTVNINALIASVYHRIKAVKPGVVFGISPQGNLHNNEKINADVFTWCAQNGYIDYICPQLYYSFENPALPFETALDAWREMPRKNTIRLYIGLALYKAGTDADEGTWLESDDILARQIEDAQKAGADGIILYSVDQLSGGAAEEEIENAAAAIESFAG